MAQNSATGLTEIKRVSSIFVAVMSLLAICVNIYLYIRSFDQPTKLAFPQEPAIGHMHCTNYTRYSYDEDTGELLNNSAVHIAVSCCGNRMEQTLVLIKSAVLLSSTNLVFHIFTETNLRPDFLAMFEEIRRRGFTGIAFRLCDNWFPGDNDFTLASWRNLFRPCASQRLFLHKCLPDVDSVLYVDTDTLFLTAPSQIWKHFKYFNESQLAGMSANQVTNVRSYYNSPGAIPHYREQGLNSGVMLMNLTRLRTRPWEHELARHFLQYKSRLECGDQDLLNIYFFFHPDYIYLCPCGMNYRSDFCMTTFTCQLPPGVLHGSRLVWHTNDEPTFKAVYTAYRNFNISSPLKDLAVDVCTELKTAALIKPNINTSCSAVSSVFLDQLVRNLDPAMHINLTACILESL